MKKKCPICTKWLGVKQHYSIKMHGKCLKCMSGNGRARLCAICKAPIASLGKKTYCAPCSYEVRLENHKRYNRKARLLLERNAL